MSEKMKQIIVAGLAVLTIVIIFGAITFLQSAKVFITSDPNGADVYSLKSHCITPCRLRVPVGDQKLWVAKDDYELAEKSIKVGLLKRNWISFTLMKAESVYAGPPPEEDQKSSAIKNLPYNSNDFNVSWDAEEEKYLIAPNIDVGMSETLSQEQEMANQWSAYVKYGNEALAWMKSNGVTPTNDNIEWWAQEYWPDGKSISIN